jgi:hypothetical protein
MGVESGRVSQPRLADLMREADELIAIFVHRSRRLVAMDRD